MKRRHFLRTLPALGTIPMAINGIPFSVMAGQSSIQRLAAQCPNDRVLIILQLHGGNDGINAVIPVANYDKYYNARANIAIPDKGTRGFIPLDSTLPNADQVGLHPDMIGIKDLYDTGRAVIVQGVSYEKNNGSHFRGRDILFMGAGADGYENSGWVGRYLNNYVSPLSYPKDFPNDTMKDPLALEFGNDMSLIFHQKTNITTSVAINNPQQFFDLVDTLDGFTDRADIDSRGLPPDDIKNTNYVKELNWILSLEEKTDQYHDRLLEVYNKGKALDPGVVYPDTYPFNAPAGKLRNPLSGQLKIISNLLSGDCQTKVFLIKLGGFDTHASQVEKYDATMGNHAALLYHISSAMKAFQDDLKARGIDQRVLTITASEFGRRIYSNGSYGTDHGTGGPVMVFGRGVNPGVIGTNPDMSKDNVELQVDYRQLYATIMKDWMCVDKTVVDSELLLGDYEGKGTTIPNLINNNITSINNFIQKRFRLNNCYPNPASNYTTISFFINKSENVTLNILDINGKTLKNVISEKMGIGEHQVTVDLRDLKSGAYFYQIKAGILDDTKKLNVIR